MICSRKAAKRRRWSRRPGARAPAYSGESWSEPRSGEFGSLSSPLTPPLTSLHQGATRRGRCRFRKTHTLDKALRIYAWFLLIVTALPAAARLAKPRELARITLLRYQDQRRRNRARIGGLIYLGLSLFAIPFLLRAEMRQKRWLVMAVIVGMVSALEFLLNSRLFSEDALARQNRLFGAVFASMAIAVALLLFTQ